MREIVLDTETTGLDPADGHRVVEIGAVEIVHQVLTGRIFHALINPERDVPQDAARVHGHTAAVLKDKPVFAGMVDEFLAFIGESRLVIHNAEFDMRFINAELTRLGREPIGMDQVVDTLALARRKHPGQPNSLDALCDRYRIDRSRRVRHGALLDAEILVEVYCELHRRPSALARLSARLKDLPVGSPPRLLRVGRRGRAINRRSEAGRRALTREYIESLGDNAIWFRYLARPG